MPGQMHDPDSATSAAWQHMEEVHRAPEPEVLAPLIERARLGADERQREEDVALELLAGLRGGQRMGWVRRHGPFRTQSTISMPISVQSKPWEKREAVAEPRKIIRSRSGCRRSIRATRSRNRASASPI